MSLAIRRLKVYLRLTIVVIVAGAVGLILFKNRSNRVPVWFFGLTDPDKLVNVVWLMLFTALGAITSWKALAFTRGLWKDLRDLQRLEQTSEAARRQIQRAVELDERERKLAEKLKQAAEEIGEPETPKE